MGCEHNAKKGQQKEKRDIRITNCLVSGKLKLKPLKYALTVMHREQKEQKKVFSIYQCDHCGSYHLATVGKRQLLQDNLERLNKLLAPT